jgi:hypothetical protein
VPRSFPEAAALLAVVLSGCSFDSFSGGRTETLGSDDESEGSGVMKPGASGTRGVADGGGDEESGGPPATSGATLPPGDDGDGGRLDLGAPETGGAVDPCEGWITFELDIGDANLVEPMQVIDVDGVGPAAYSLEENAGDVEFSIDVQCPGTYQLYAYVVDLWAGVHYNDPDSYEVSWPGGGGSWFYGCQTEDSYDGWHWLRVLTGVMGESCDTAIPVQLELGAGPALIRFHNREEEAYWGGVAAIARVVVTNDPDYAPM